MRLIYINPGDSSVMEAQVLQLLSYYYSLNKFEIILLQGYKNNTEKYKLLCKLKPFNFINVIWFKTYPNYSIFKFNAQLSLNKVLKDLCHNNFIIHTRGELYGAFAKLFLLKYKLPLNLLVDIRGVSIEEVELYMSKSNILKRNKILCYKRAYGILKKDPHTKITVVSESAKDFLSNKYGFNSKSICVHPNITGNQFVFSLDKRKSIRNELNISDNQLLVVCSSNGNAAWQKDIILMDYLVKRGCTVLNLSSQKVDIKGVITIKVPFAQMPDYLSAADYAVLWRDNNSVNNTASPSKFSEFACMGLSVIHNRTVGIASDFIRQYHAGILINNPEEIMEIELPLIEVRRRVEIAQKARDVFGVEKTANSYINMYFKVCHENSDSSKQ
jgi:hypothetical protein